MTTRKQFIAISAIVCILVALTGCGNEDDSLDESSPVIAAIEAPKDMPGGGIESEITEKDGCIVLGEQLVVWGAGTTWDEDQDEVLLPSGERLPLGSKVTGGGGEIPDPRSYFGNAVADRLDKCNSKSGVIYVVA